MSIHRQFEGRQFAGRQFAGRLWQGVTAATYPSRPKRAKKIKMRPVKGPAPELRKLEIILAGLMLGLELGRLDWLIDRVFVIGGVATGATCAPELRSHLQLIGGGSAVYDSGGNAVRWDDDLWIIECEI